MSKNFDARVEALEEKYSSVNKKLEEEKMELMRKFDNSQQEILDLIRKRTEERKECQEAVNKMNMILSFLNINPMLRPADPSNSGAQTVTRRLIRGIGYH